MPISTTLLLLAACVLPPQTPSPPDTATRFAERFEDATLRVGLHHVGDSKSERYMLDHLRVDTTWAGPRSRLIDDSGFGKHRVELRDLESQTLLYSNGFASIFGEWQTTAEARMRERAFEESVRVPMPRRPVQLNLETRQDDGSFRRVFQTTIDPASREVDRSPPVPGARTTVLFEHGDPSDHVDLLIASDGYTAEQEEKFLADAARLSAVLFSTQPFLRSKAAFNLRALFVPSPEAGISNPRKGVWRKSPLGLSFNAFDSDRYVLTFRDFALRENLASAPYDALILLFNERKYGGGGIYNLWASVAADTEPAAYVFVHEFGHSFAGLADEYYTSQVAYEDFARPGVEPWEPNVTALLDPARLKWRDLIETGTPLPTPWDQARFDAVDLEYQRRRQALLAAGASETEMEALFRDVKRDTSPLLAAESHFGRVGAFEGASYQAKGLFRPEVDCIMFTRNPTSFCRVCERAIERGIERYLR